MSTVWFSLPSPGEVRGSNDQARVGLEREKSVTMGTRWGSLKRPSTPLPFPQELSFRGHREGRPSGFSFSMKKTKALREEGTDATRVPGPSSGPQERLRVGWLISFISLSA